MFLRSAACDVFCPYDVVDYQASSAPADADDVPAGQPNPTDPAGQPNPTDPLLCIDADLASDLLEIARQFDDADLASDLLEIARQDMTSADLMAIVHQFDDDCDTMSSIYPFMQHA